MKIRKDDTVIIRSGDDRNKIGKVIKVFPAENKVLVEGVGSYKKHVKRQADGTEGGVITRFRPINASKVSLIDPKSQKPTRVRTTKNGNEIVRTSVKSGEVIANATK